MNASPSRPPPAPPDVVVPADRLLRVVANGLAHSGDALAVVRALHATSPFDAEDADAYMEHVLRRVRLLGVGDHEVCGETPRDRAASFLSALVRAGLASVAAVGPHLRALN